MIIKKEKLLNLLNRGFTTQQIEIMLDVLKDESKERRNLNMGRVQSQVIVK